MSIDAQVVSLVGAGPGDPELITVRGIKRLQSADVVVYDELVGRSLLAFCSPGAELIFVGKRCGRHTMPQEQINALLVARAREGRRVVRLKGGDPFIFGRGGEELAELANAGIPVEVIPGVTAASAAGAAAGVPLTHRDFSSGVVFITGHASEGKQGASPDWDALVRTRMTLCLYMGVKRAGDIAAQLICAGMTPQTPVALVSRASLPGQSILLLTLSELVRGEHGEVDAPALVIIGEVARFPVRINQLAEAGHSRVLIESE